MKKWHIIIACSMLLLILTNARSIAGYFNPADDYVGKYTFSGGPVQDVDIFLKDTTLSYKTADDEGVLTKLAVDSFAYKGNSEGTVAFKRNGEKKVERMMVYVMSGEVLEAVKEKAAGK